MTVYVLRELWKYPDVTTIDIERLIAVSANIDTIEEKAWKIFYNFYDWYWENEICEESDHDKRDKEEEIDALGYELHRLKEYNEPVEYSHEWYPYCIKIDKMEVE